MEINGRPLSIISEAVGGTNVDNCPHACNTNPCGPFAQCIPNLENYECQCNPSNLQCNKAEELSSQQVNDVLSLHKDKQPKHQNFENEFGFVTTTIQTAFDVDAKVVAKNEYQVTLQSVGSSEKITTNEITTIAPISVNRANAENNPVDSSNVNNNYNENNNADDATNDNDDYNDDDYYYDYNQDTKDDAAVEGTN